MSQIETMHFKTSSGIKNIVGQDLITDRFVAIFELVKNSYDAHASVVVVSFNSDSVRSNILIRDNGHGMNKVDLERSWLHLAYSEKKEGRINNQRAFVGSKGVGRFSCDSLGSLLTIRTKKCGDPVENILYVNWKDFEKSLNLRFEQIDVKYSSRPISEEHINSSYTELFIEELRHSWDEIAIRKVIDSLKRLKNPFDSADGFDIYCGKNLGVSGNEFILDERYKKFLVKSDISDVLKNKSIFIEAIISSETIKINLFDRGRRIYSLEKFNDTVLKGVDVKIVLNYLTTSAKMTFSRRMGVDAVRYGNVFVYKNNFRVNPYGDTDVDLFSINVRKAQGYNRNLGTREIIGFIDIKDFNGLFKETSSRNNGFVENTFFYGLKDVYMDYAHKMLERYVHLVNWGEENNTELTLDSVDLSATEKFYKSLSRKFNIVFFDESFSFEEAAPKVQLEKIAFSLPEKQKSIVQSVIKSVKKLELENKEKKIELVAKDQVIQVLEKQNKNLISKRPESSYGEQLGHHLPAMADRLNSSIKDLHKLELSISDDNRKKFYEALRKIRRTELELRSFKNLLLKTDLDLRSPQVVNWIEIAKWYEKDKEKNNLNMKFVVSADNSFGDLNWMVRSNVLEVVMMFDNFFQNAHEHGGSFLDVHFEELKINVSSNSSKIADVNLKRVFELGFTTKENGTGIGLNQIQTFINRIGLSIVAKNQDGLVCFEISRGK